MNLGVRHVGVQSQGAEITDCLDFWQSASSDVVDKSNKDHSSLCAQEGLFRSLCTYTSAVHATFPFSFCFQRELH